MNITQKKYILFDLDGTITDSAPGITNSVRHTLTYYGMEENDLAVLNKFVGPPLISSFKNIYGFSQEKAEEAVRYYREYYSVKGIFESVLYDGIKELLEVLSKTDKKVILATAKPEPYTKRILEYFGLLQYFDFVAGSTFDGTRAEKDEIITYALNTLSITDTKECVMIGDRCYDIDGAHVNEMEAVGVLYGYGSSEELSGSKADYLVNSVSELKTLLGV